MQPLDDHIQAYIRDAEVHEEQTHADENHLNDLLTQIFNDIESLKSSQTNKLELYNLLDKAISALNAEGMQKYQQQLFTQIVAAFNLDPITIKKMDDLKDFIETQKPAPISTSDPSVKQPHPTAAQPSLTYKTSDQPGVAQPHPKAASIDIDINNR